MKNILIISALTLPAGMFAQGQNTNINPPPQSQIQNVNYYDQVDLNNDINPVQTNLGNQQANPPAQVQQQQSSRSFFGAEENKQEKTTGCKDCDAVKKAIKESHASSGHSYGGSFSIKKWGNKFSARMHMKIKKMFAHRKKIKTSYDICFNWK